MTILHVDVTDKVIDPAFEMAQLQNRHMGAISVFIGTVRDDYDDELVALHLEHYETMTRNKLHDIAAEASERWSLGQLRVVHRIGRLLPEEMIVLVAASSAHRADSLEAVHFVMDYLKTDAPFWKAEETKEGLSWVSARDADDIAKEKWNK